MLLAVAALGWGRRGGGGGGGGEGEGEKKQQQQQRLDFVITQKLAKAFTILYSCCLVTLWQKG
jgi:hypothetical protein